MKHYFYIFSLLALLISPSAQSDTQKVEDDFTAGQPLMIIRFNKQNIYYQLPLYKTIKKALQIHPSASFQILSVIPTTGDYHADNEGSKEAAQYAALVTTALSDMGLPASRYRTNYTTDSSSSDYEVRIFIR
jgi:hypothetical protein